MNIKQNLILLVVSSALLLPLSVAAADGAALYKEKACHTCHGEDADTPIMPAYPKLAGQNAEYLLAQMKDIKSGTRSNGQSVIMKGLVAAISDEDLDAIAQYVAGLGAKTEDVKK